MNTRPWPVQTLLVLVYMGAAFTLLISIEQFIAAGALADGGDVLQALVASGVDPSYASKAADMVRVLAVVSLIAAIVHVVLAIFIARARNWARWVLVVLVGIGTLTDISWVIDGRWFAGVMLTIYDICILVLALAPATSAYLKGRTVTT